MLGLAFSPGALMGFAVTFGRIDVTAMVLYAGAISWVIGYDTIYAHQDAEDDALIGIKSTARLFGTHTHRALVLFYGLAVMLIGVALASADARWPAGSGWSPSPCTSHRRSCACGSRIPGCVCACSSRTGKLACCCLRDCSPTR